ncbi:family 1 glycosylhydrolase [Candidatus Kaiserbacteria bacterium]|nr:family 1 glycosylhydrolase [Candidatus Kaiserbacteria bacterium]
MAVPKRQFPDGFYWGAGTSAYQVEGNIYNTDWALAAEEGRVPRAGKSSDHYNYFEEDFDLAKELGHNAHRFSIEWARIEPEEGTFDHKEIEHYREVLKALRKRGLEPYVTLWHFTLPLWFSEKGGFERKDAPEIFARYCSFVMKELGDLFTHVSTMNEPNVYATHGWLYGAWPPFKQWRILGKKIGKEDGTSRRTQSSFLNIFRYFKVSDNLIRAHRQAYFEIKKVSPKAEVSVVKHVHYFYANKNPLNKLLARFMNYQQTTRFMNKVADSCDEIGLNFYRSTQFGDTRTHTYTDMGWKIVPEDIYGALMLLRQYKKPIFIAEAGLADANDVHRAEYIRVQVSSVWRAIQEGVDVRGHMYWSLLDNYEWALGYEKRFGLVEIDYQTLKRTPRPSAQVYQKICVENAVE